VRERPPVGDRGSTTECLIRCLFDAAGHPASIGRSTDLALYLTLVHIGLQAGSLRPYVSRRRLSDAGGLCEDTVSASLHRLEDAGLIRHLGQANDYGTHRYEIRPPMVPDIPSAVDTTLWIGGCEVYCAGLVTPLDVDPGHDAFHLHCLGHTGLANVLSLTVHGALSYRQLSTLTGSSVRQVRRVVRRMMGLMVADIDAEHRVRLREDIDWDRVAEDGGTAGTRDRRHERNEQARRRWLRPGQAA
jgi:hypothetical protein